MRHKEGSCVFFFFFNVLLFVAGWGKIRHPGNSHHTLQQAKISPVSESDCKRKSKLLFYPGAVIDIFFYF